MKSLVEKALQGAVGLGGDRVRRAMARAIAIGPSHHLETVSHIRHAGASFKLYGIGDTAKWRADTFSTKEPETLDWIDAMGPADVMWDIGANVGVYSMYAAARGVKRVLAFEPSSANYHLLNQNIEINKFDVVVSAYCVAISDGTRAGELNMTTTGYAEAMSSFGQPVDEFGREFAPVFKQAAISYSIDGFVETFAPPFPNHIKIDVDGIEEQIVNGAQKTLADPRVKSVSIELDEGQSDLYARIFAAMTGAGLKLHSRRHADAFVPGELATIYNCWFKRG